MIKNIFFVNKFPDYINVLQQLRKFTNIKFAVIKLLLNYLRNNKIGEEGSVKLSECIKNHNTLEELYLNLRYYFIFIF